MRAFFGWASEPGPEQLITYDPTRAVRRAKVRKKPPPRAQADDLARILGQCEPRDRVLLLLLLQTGIRRGEAADARIEDYDRDRQRLYVRGKGSKERWVVVPEEAVRELEPYLAYLGRRSGPLFPSSHRPGQGLAPGTISHIVRQAGERAGARLWTHLCRHTALSDAAENGATAWELQAQAGHTYSSTTDAYVHISERSVERAMAGRRYRGGRAQP